MIEKNTNGSNNSDVTIVESIYEVSVDHINLVVIMKYK